MMLFCALANALEKDAYVDRELYSVFGGPSHDICIDYEDCRAPGGMHAVAAEASKQSQEPQVLTSPVHLRDQQDTQDTYIQSALSIELWYDENDQTIIHLPRFRYEGKAARLDPQEQLRREKATKIAIGNHLNGHVLPYGQMYPLFLQNGNILLPPSLYKLSYYMSQLVVIKQREPGTCGSRSVANALALRDAIARGLPLDSHNIQAMAQKYEGLHTQNGTTSRQQIQLARRFDMHHTYAMTILKNDPLDGTKINRFPFTVIESTELPVVNLYNEAEILEDIVRTIRSQHTVVASFLCHLDGGAGKRGHAVVVSIVKKAGSPTRIIYMDSNNLPVVPCSQAAAYICYLYWQCVA
jgi:hypothetical protein